MRKPYPSDLTDQQWEIIEPLIPVCPLYTTPQDCPRFRHEICARGLGKIDLPTPHGAIRCPKESATNCRELISAMND